MQQKFDIQEAEYSFPYHHIPHFKQDGTPSTVRPLRWGLEYLCYQKHIAEMVKACKPESVLEVGCGDGRFLKLLGTEVPRRKGIDLAQRAISFAKAFDEGVEFERIDAAELDETFDVVVAIEVLEHIPDDAVDEFLQTLANRTRTGGTVIVAVPTQIRALPPKHFRHYDADTFEKQVKASGAPLDLVEMQYVYKQPKWLSLLQKLMMNRYWTFEAGVIQRLLWKITWKKLRFADASNGCHLAAAMRKK